MAFTKLIYPGFEDFIWSIENLYGAGGLHYVFKFNNDYGASVIKHKWSYGAENDLFELAVVKFDKPIQPDPVIPGVIGITPQASCEIDWHLCYSTPITDDVLRYLTNEDVLGYLQQIKELKADTETPATGKEELS